ncbi:MAG: MFS transporter [Fimbriimonadaceae bacterium]
MAQSPQVTQPASPEAPRSNGQIFTYFGTITFLYWLVVPHQGFVDIPITFILKNRLHLDSNGVSNFRLFVCIPVYFGLVFGFLRDRWHPFGLRDRGYFMLFGIITALVFVGLIFVGPTYWGLFVGVFVAMVVFRLVAAAYQGLIALIGQEDLMSGRLSTLWNIVSYVPIMLGYFVGGILEGLQTYYIFLGAAIVMALIALFGLWKPRSVFEGTYEKPLAQTSNLAADLRRLMRHKAIYPAILICFLWNFAPGSATPLQFYLTDKLHLSDAVFNNYYAIFTIAFIPTFFLYGALCKRVALRKLLIWGTVFAVPQMIPLMFIHSEAGALWLAAPTGLMGGVATAAYYDLAMRSCPAGLQGTLMLAVDGVFILSSRGGDRLGTAIYTSGGVHGFFYCVVATTIVYALILPLILWIPKTLIATADGEPNPEFEAA